jgi:hypothetical protein
VLVRPREPVGEHLVYAAVPQLGLGEACREWEEQQGEEDGDGAIHEG